MGRGLLRVGIWWGLNNQRGMLLQEQVLRVPVPGLYLETLTFHKVCYSKNFAFKTKRRKWIVKSMCVVWLAYVICVISSSAKLLSWLQTDILLSFFHTLSQISSSIGTSTRPPITSEFSMPVRLHKDLYIYIYKFPRCLKR